MLSRLLYSETGIDFHVLLTHQHVSFKHESSHWFPSRQTSASCVMRIIEIIDLALRFHAP